MNKRVWRISESKSRNGCETNYKNKSMKRMLKSLQITQSAGERTSLMRSEFGNRCAKWRLPKGSGRPKRGKKKVLNC